MESGVYKIINLITNKVYIGSSMDLSSRSYDHFYALNKGNHHSVKLQRSYNKHGEDNFIFEKIEICEISDLVNREQFYIDLFDSYKFGYNCLPFAGSNLGMIHSDETKEKLRKASLGNKNMLGKKHSEETKEKIREKLKGQKLSEETKEKMSIAGKGRVVSEETIEKLRILNTGRKASDESKKKMSDAKLGKKQSDEVIEKRSKSNTGKKRTKEQKDRMSESMKGIKKRPRSKEAQAKIKYFKKRIAHISDNGDIIKEYESITECSIELNIDNRRISDVLTGRMVMYKKMRFIYL